jgi:hypothetical protein
MVEARAVRWSRVLIALAVLSPLLAFVAVAGIKLGVWDWRLGYSVLAMRVGLGLAALGLVAGLAGGLIAIRQPRARATGLVALVMGVVTAGVYGAHIRTTGPEASTGRADPPSFQATTNVTEPPSFSGALARERAAAGAEPATGAGFQSCEVASIPAQVAPGAAAYALREAGFDVLGFGVGRADGTMTGLWFGFTHDATIRIRPGQTDVRVASREARDDGGQACRLVTRIVAELQPPPS